LLKKTQGGDILMEHIQYRVNDVAQETEHSTLTALQILRHGEIDPDLHFLIETHPDRVDFQEKPEEPIHMVPHMRFETERQVIEYKVNDEEQTTRHRHLTAREILVHAGIDPATNYLTEVFPEHISFEGKPDERIRMHQHMKFISVSVKPTPVSDFKPFADQLKCLGYKVSQNASKVTFPFEIQTGKLRGQQVTLGFITNGDFILHPPSGPHVCPRLLPIHPEKAPHPVGGVHESEFGKDWEYWSRPIEHWNETRRNAADYMAHIHRLFETL
jgi:hypothetical protein